MNRIIFATGNAGKMKEIREILGDMDAEILSMKEAGIQTDIVENGTTFEENARIKAKAVAQFTKDIVLADDSGLGNIGKRVADIAKMFGCHVIYFSASGKNYQPGYERVDLDTLLTQSDIVSVHAPLNDNTRHLMNESAFKKMKKSAIFLNLGRGPIVDEQALTDAIINDEIMAAGLDVLDVEPMSIENPLRKINDSEKLIITPHIAWASIEARTRLMEIILGQIKEWAGIK